MPAGLGTARRHAHDDRERMAGLPRHPPQGLRYAQCLSAAWKTGDFGVTPVGKVCSPCASGPGMFGTIIIVGGHQRTARIACEFGVNIRVDGLPAGALPPPAICHIPSLPGVT